MKISKKKKKENEKSSEKSIANPSQSLIFHISSLLKLQLYPKKIQVFCLISRKIRTNSN